MPFNNWQTQRSITLSLLMSAFFLSETASKFVRIFQNPFLFDQNSDNKGFTYLTC